MDKIVHFEIPVDNEGRAVSFYKAVFDWKIDKVKGMDYSIVYTSEVDEKKCIKRKELLTEEC